MRPVDERGSVLMLVPAAVLVLLVLGAICVDSAVVFLGQRDLADRTAAAANDIAGFAVSDAAFYGDGDRRGAIALDPDRAAAYAHLAFDPDRVPGGYASWDGDAETEGRTVTVTATAEVRSIFAKAIPGGRDTTTVRAVATATARDS